LLCTHLSWWPDGGPAAIGRQLTATFENVQVWLPPQGADSLIWVASEAPISLQRLTERYENAAGPLAHLGYSSATGLAGTAIAGWTGIAHWGAGAPPLPSADHLGPSLFAKPVFHAAGLAGLQSTAADIWDTSNSSADLAEVDEVLSARRMFLALIDDATRGQIAAAFDTARALLETHGEIGAKALEPLIDRHIKDAQIAIRLGATQGPTSDAWAEAQRFATTARMIAPHSPRPHVVLAEVALGRGDVQRAEGHFRTVLKRDPTHIGALDGLARCGRLRGDDGQVEQALRATTRHAPRDWRTWHNLGIYLLEKNRLEEALEALRDAAALAPKNEASPLIGMAKVYLAKGEAPGALVRAQRAIQLDKDNGIAWYLRGRAHFALERYDEAERDFRSAVLADRSLIEARGAIGQVRAIRGDYAAAAEQFRAVLTVDPKNIPARENLRRLAPHLPQGLEAQP
jgi:tetratricopeptide (TPR) repeat protein